MNNITMKMNADELIMQALREDYNAQGGQTNGRSGNAKNAEIDETGFRKSKGNGL